MAKYIQVEENKWYHFTKEDYLICCDCFLTHKITHGKRGNKLYVKFSRDNRTTAAYRRGKEGKEALKKLLK